VPNTAQAAAAAAAPAAALAAALHAPQLLMLLACSLLLPPLPVLLKRGQPASSEDGSNEAVLGAGCGRLAVLLHVEGPSWPV
jgi:hypothetical protein